MESPRISVATAAVAQLLQEHSFETVKQIIDAHTAASSQLHHHHFRAQHVGAPRQPCGDIQVLITEDVEAVAASHAPASLIAAMFRIVFMDKSTTPPTEIHGVPWQVRPHPDKPHTYVAAIVHWTAGNYTIQVLFNGHPVAPVDGETLDIQLHRKVALVLSGGGSFGAFQVGVLPRLAKERDDEQWADVYGVSVGSINGSMFLFDPNHLHYELNKEKPANKNQAIALYMDEMYRRVVKDRHIHQPWCTCCYEGCCGCGNCCNGGCGQCVGLVCGKKSLLNTQPLYDTLCKYWQPPADDKRRFTAGVVNLHTSLYESRPFRGVDMNGESPAARQQWDALHQAVRASSSFPVYFSPVQLPSLNPDLKGQMCWFSDGGLRNELPLRDALTQGYTEIDIIMNDPKAESIERWAPGQTGEGLNPLSVLGQVISTLCSEVLNTDIPQAVQDALPRHIRLNIFRPQHAVGKDPLDFDPAKIVEKINIGRGIAEQWMAAGLDTVTPAESHKLIVVHELPRAIQRCYVAPLLAPAAMAAPAAPAAAAAAAAPIPVVFQAAASRQ